MVHLLEIKEQLRPFLHYELCIAPKIMLSICIVFALIFFCICSYYKHSFGWLVVNGVITFIVSGLLFIGLSSIVPTGMTNLVNTEEANYDYSGPSINTHLVAKQANHEMSTSISAKRHLPKLRKKLTYVKRHHQQNNQLDDKAINVYQNHLEHKINQENKEIKNAKHLQIKWYYYL